MPALVLIIPVSRSELPEPSSTAVIEAPSPVTCPVATDGRPPLPPALPTATTFWPTPTLEESPMVAVFSPEAPVSLSTAMSWVGS